jgi:hypothetical protein
MIARMTPRREVHRWYCSVGWLRRRRYQLRMEPLCRLCLEGAISCLRWSLITLCRIGATTVGALRSLYKACHDGLDRTNNPRAPVLEDGTPSDPNHPWNARS